MRLVDAFLSGNAISHNLFAKVATFEIISEGRLKATPLILTYVTGSDDLHYRDRKRFELRPGQANRSNEPYVRAFFCARGFHGRFP